MFSERKREHRRISISWKYGLPEQRIYCVPQTCRYRTSPKRLDSIQHGIFRISFRNAAAPQPQHTASCPDKHNQRATREQSGEQLGKQLGIDPEKSYDSTHKPLDFVK
jgi:hypothetical protein